MSDPLGKYTNYTYGDGGILGQLEETFGNGCEDLKDNEKLWLIAQLASDLWQATDFGDEDIRSDVENAASLIVKDLQFGDVLGVLQCVLHNLRYS